MRSRRRFGWIAALVLAGCGGRGGDGDIWDDISGEDQGAVRPDIPVVIPDYPTYETVEPDLLRLDASDNLEAVTEVGPEVIPGAPGAPCKKNSDCDSEFCIETPNGRQCAEYCYAGEDICPPGYRCSQVQAYPDTVYVCVYLYPRLCRPCTDNKDCEAALAPGPALCVPQDPIGRFCGSPCATTDDCPPSYECRSITSLAGTTSRQCVPSDGVCACSKAAIADEASTPCTIANDYGRCPGKRVCTSEGLSACSAPEPVPEACNGRDDDCNGLTDDVEPRPCEIENAYGRCPGMTSCQAGQERCLGTPAAQEACNQVDDDCDQETDEPGAIGCATFYRDEDGDTYGVTADSKCLCASVAPYTASRGNDCDDQKIAVHPGATESCNGRDDDCDNKTDEEDAEGCTWFIKDSDADGWGAGADRKCLCAPAGLYTAARAGDCDDLKPNVHPEAMEVCNGLDDDCDGSTDPENTPGCIPYFRDVDGDLYGDPATPSRCLCAPDVGQRFTALQAGDCNDSDAGQSPSATEVCDSKDNDCDGLTDETGAVGCVVRYRDEDGDGYGSGAGSCTCTASPPVTALQPGDCDDGNPAVHPWAVETCNGRDDDCDALTDEENASDCRDFYWDEDGDGWGTIAKKCLCGAAGVYRALLPGDCDDKTWGVNPGVLEVCGNGVDDNCSGTTDEENGVGCEVFYYDFDGDGWGTSIKKCLCEASGFFRASVAGDCDDTRSTIHPGAVESCNGLDDDCDGATDEEGASGCQIRYYDGDGDGYGVMMPAPRCLCAPDVAAKYTALVASDCDDHRASVYPGAMEYCNGRDDDCDGATDEEGASGCQAYYRDQDQDGFGTDEYRCLCAPDVAGRYTALGSGDCDDSDPAIRPGAAICGKDADCDGSLLDVGEPCDDGNGVAWDGCTACVVTEARLNFLTTGDQGMPAVAALPAGGWLAAYQMYFASPATRKFDVGVRLVSAQGLPVGSSDTIVNTTPAGDQVAPSVAVFPGGMFVVTWQSEGQDGDSWSIWARLFDSAGSPLGGEIAVNTYIIGAQQSPRVVALTNGDYVVVWQSWGQDGDGSGIFGRRFSSSGGPPGAEFQVNTTTAGNQSSPAIARLTDNRLVIVWETPSLTPGVFDVRWRILNPDGTPVTNENSANTAGSASCTKPDVAVFGDNRFVIAWERDSEGDADVYVRRFRSDGIADGLETRLHVFATGAQMRPRLAALADARFVAAWMSEYQDGSYFGVFARRFDAQGSPLGNEFQANVFTTGEQSFPAVAASSAATAFVAWQSLSQDGSGYGVYGRPFPWP